MYAHKDRGIMQMHTFMCKQDTCISTKPLYNHSNMLAPTQTRCMPSFLCILSKQKNTFVYLSCVHQEAAILCAFYVPSGSLEIMLTETVCLYRFVVCVQPYMWLLFVYEQSGCWIKKMLLLTDNIPCAFIVKGWHGCQSSRRECVLLAT